MRILGAHDITQNEKQNLVARWMINFAMKAAIMLKKYFCLHREILFHASQQFSMYTMYNVCVYLDADNMSNTKAMKSKIMEMSHIKNWVNQNFCHWSKSILMMMNFIETFIQQNWKLFVIG